MLDACVQQFSHITPLLFLFFFRLTEQGWIDGVAILIAVLIVALVTAGNDYSKELQFRALEKTSEEGHRAMVLRDGISQLVRAEKRRGGGDDLLYFVFGDDKV